MPKPTSGTAASVIPPNDVVRLAQAFDYAARAHVDQQRKGERKEPYLNHLAEVAYLVAEATGGTDSDVVIAAVLHDTLEDQPDKVNRAQLVENFGEDVAALVSEVTDDKSLSKAERKRLQIETAPNKSDRAKLLKLADKISNLRSLATSPPANWSADRRREYVTWSGKVVAGCADISPWLESQYDEACSLLAPLPDIALVLMSAAAGDASKPIDVGGATQQLTDRESLAISAAWEFTIHPSRVPLAVEQLRQKGAHGSWLVLMFNTSIHSPKTSDHVLNLQFSINDGVLGLDWVLLGERNIADRELVAEFIKSKGHSVAEQEMNEVEFLRVEDGDLVALGVAIAKELYKIGNSYPLGLQSDGFRYQPSPSAGELQ